MTNETSSTNRYTIPVSRQFYRVLLCGRNTMNKERLFGAAFFGMGLALVLTILWIGINILMCLPITTVKCSGPTQIRETTTNHGSFPFNDHTRVSYEEGTVSPNGEFHGLRSLSKQDAEATCAHYATDFMIQSLRGTF